MPLVYRFCIVALLGSSISSIFSMDQEAMAAARAHPKMAEEIAEGLVHSMALMVKGPVAREIIEATQRKFDVVGAAQRGVERCPHVPANTDVLNAFLDLGVLPYEGWHVGGGYIWGSSYEVSHFESRDLCNNLIALKNFNSLGKILTMHPSFATKSILLRSIAQCDPANFAHIDEVHAAYDSAGKRYPKLPYTAYLDFIKKQRNSFDHARWTIEFARWALAHNYDLNSPKRKMGGKTFFDLVANALFYRHDLVGNGVHFKDLLVFLLDNRCLSHNPIVLTALLQEKIHSLGKTHSEFDQEATEQERQIAQNAPEYKINREILDLLNARLLCPEVVIELGEPLDV